MSKAIFLKDGVYVTMPDAYNYLTSEAIIHNKDLRYNSYMTKSQYGNRVVIRAEFRDYIKINVDGIPIVDSEGSEYCSYEQATCYLNAMAANGVDVFLANYKKSVEQYYNDLKNLRQDVYFNIGSSDNSSSSDLMNKLKGIMEKMPIFIGVIFSLNVWMSAALDNQRVIDITDTIIETYQKQ